MVLTKSSNKANAIVLTALIIVAATLVSFDSRSISRAEPVTPIHVGDNKTSDGYHYNTYKDNPNISNYGEWWFFNLNQNNIQAVIQYSLWDPTGRTSYSFGLMYVSVHRSGHALDVIVPIPWDYVQTNEKKADLTMGPETISTCENGTYIIQGAVSDEFGNEISWNLHYKSQVKPLDTTLTQTSATEEMNWYAQMPSAKVTGTLTVNGEIYIINASGYHDHNWGPWKLIDTVWNWFQTNNDRFAIVGYDYYLLNEGQISLQINGLTVVFSKEQYEVTNTNWIITDTIVPGMPLLFPSTTIIDADNGKYTLTLTINADATGYVASQPIDNQIWLVLESNAAFTGEFTGPGICQTISDGGFREFSLDLPLT